MSRKLEPDYVNTFIDERVVYLIPKFEELAPYSITERKKGKSLGSQRLDGWEKLALQESRLLKLTYPDDKPDAEKEYGTCLRQITALNKALQQSAKTYVKDPKLVNSVKTIAKNFSNSLNYLFREYKTCQNIRYREKVAVRRKKENRVEIDLTESLIFAKDILTQAKNDTLCDLNHNLTKRTRHASKSLRTRYAS